MPGGMVSERAPQRQTTSTRVPAGHGHGHRSVWHPTCSRLLRHRDQGGEAAGASQGEGSGSGARVCLLESAVLRGLV